jgi:hypothetical protein
MAQGKHYWGVRLQDKFDAKVAGRRAGGRRPPAKGLMGREEEERGGEPGKPSGRWRGEKKKRCE